MNFIVGGNVKIPDEFIMDFNIKNLSKGITGNWDFKFKVSNEKIKTKGRTLKQKSSSGSGLSSTHTYYSQILLKNIYEDSKTLTFIPYVISSKEFLKWQKALLLRNLSLILKKSL